jgi:hypothetical protein
MEEQEPTPELAEAVDEVLPSSRELAVVDPSDEHEVFLRMDDHDVRLLLDQIQSSALRKYVYELSRGNEKIRGLTVHAVQDIVQRINWTGKAKIGVVPETLTVERITENAGNGEEPFWVATIFARDEITGSSLPGSSMEPVYMSLRKSTADRKRADGVKIPEDNKVFDSFSRWKAIQKATRNALAGFIPEEIEQTVIAMFAKDPSRVQRIQTEAEARVAELPPALTDDRAKEQIAKARELYESIREIGGGRGKVDFTPGHFNAYLTAAQHDHDRLDDLLGYLAQRRADLVEKYEGK